MAAPTSDLRSLAYRLVKIMRSTGNRSSVVDLWKKKVSEWAENNPKSLDARAVADMLPLWQVRPFYTASELAPLLPSLFVATGLKTNPGPSIGPATTKNILLKAGLPMLGQGAFYAHPITGQLDQYFIVERIHYWAKVPVDQKDFERQWKSQPSKP